MKSDLPDVNYSVTKLPEHLKSGGIPPFFRVRPWHHYCLPFGYTATFITSGFFSPVTDSSFCFPDTERYFRRILNAPTASALYLTPSVIYMPRSFRFDASAYLFLYGYFGCPPQPHSGCLLFCSILQSIWSLYEDNPSLYSAFFCKVSGYVSMILDILSLFPIAAHTKQTALWRSFYESIFPMKDISFQG